MIKKHLLLVLCLWLGCLSLAALAQDQLFPTSLSHFRFNFLQPGARAAAMGGAFIAQGNDATGSETNPAGLLFIPKPILFAEYRYFEYTANRAYSNNDTDVLYKDFPSSTSSPVFLSFVYPWKEWAFAVYRQELANFTVDFANDDFYVPSTIGTDHFTWFVNRTGINLDFKLVNYGFSVARRFHETFAVGVSVRAAQMSFKAHENANLDPERDRPPYFPDLLVYTEAPDQIGHYMQMDDDDWQVSFVVGAQYKPNDILSIGGVYRYGETHKLDAVFYDNLQLPGIGSLRTEYPEFEINVPDRLGVAVSVTPNANLTFLFDFVRIFYSDLNDQFLAVLAPEIRQYFGWEDGNEYRVGAEYLFPVGRSSAIALRAGYYPAPDPSIHYLGGVENDPNPIIQRYYLAFPITYPEVGWDHHVTFGAGFVFGGKFQLDVAGDLGRDKDYFALSGMYYF